MALAASHASSSALMAVTREIPASPFAQLLRQSRFATYDPQIRKTYTSPKQFVERGYWGTKRPLTQRKRNTYLTITQWEARQHYVEWDKSEDEVRFVRRMEELDIRPGGSASSQWAQTLGPAKHTWLVDSEFSPLQWSPLETKKGDEAQDEEIVLAELGNRGSGGDHAKRRLDVAQTIQALPRQAAQPAPRFRGVHRTRGGVPKTAEGIDPKSRIDGKTLTEIARTADPIHHRLFLAEQTDAEFADPTNQRIQPQPHRAAGLLYSHPSSLDTLFRTQPKPGIVLTTKSDTGRFTAVQDRPAEEYIASFAGLAATLPKAAAAGKTPLMNPAVERERWPTAAAELRPTQLLLGSVPRVVGRDPEGLRGVRVQLKVTARDLAADPKRPNPYPPGSRMYAAIPPFEQAPPRGVDIARRRISDILRGRGADIVRGRGAAAGASTGSATGETARQRFTRNGNRMVNRPLLVQPAHTPSTLGATMQTPQQAVQNKDTLDMLQGLLDTSKKGGEVRDDDL
ncbi:hypothetical protein FB451DRAFT_1571125 [Mycena latifolia]|nr:hypothetical protein FB451DRAFT_1571125 [Mycena latifolia]